MTMMLDRWHDFYHADGPAPIGECVYCDDARMLDRDMKSMYRYNALESHGYQALMSEIRLSMDPGDLWGTAMEWRGAIADVHYAINGETLPGYQLSLGIGPNSLTDEYAAETVALLVQEGSATEEDYRRVFYVLGRWANVLRSMGRDY